MLSQSWPRHCPSKKTPATPLRRRSLQEPPRHRAASCTEVPSSQNGTCRKAAVPSSPSSSQIATLHLGVYMAGSHRSGIRPCPYASMFKPCAIHLATISTSRECLIIPARRCSINVTPVKRPCILSFKSYAPVPRALRKQTLGLRECDWTLSHIWCLIIRDIELSTTD